MRRQDDSVRLRAYGSGVLALIAALGLFYAYTSEGSSIIWWLVLAGGLAGAVHYYRRSRK